LDKLLKDNRQKISEEQKFRLIHEIAVGMCHLHRFHIVHRDLAARNILLTEPTPNAQPKISVFDFYIIIILYLFVCFLEYF
jgi:serine/threonine protein kinase